MAGKSTNVRTEITLAGLRLVGRTLGGVSPALASRWAERLFFTPRRHRLSRSGERMLQAGEARQLEVGGERLSLWEWGEGPRVLLVHGWSGRAGQMTAFVAPLVEAGFRVVAFDAPAHGASSGRRTSLPAYADVVREVAASLGGVHALVAHSMGAAASAVALRDGLEVERAVLLAPAADPRKAVASFAQLLQLRQEVVERMVRRFEVRLRRSISDFDVPSFAPRLSVPALVLHDVEDTEVAFSSGHAIAQAWPGARLVATTGLGHNRILYTPEVVEQAVAFLAESHPGRRREPLRLLAPAPVVQEASVRLTNLHAR